MNDEPRPPPSNMAGAAAQAAGGVIDALKAQPVLLALVLFNAAFVGVVYYTARDTRMRQGEVVENLLANQSKMQELLARCSNPRSGTIIIPPATDGGPPS